MRRVLVVAGPAADGTQAGKLIEGIRARNASLPTKVMTPTPTPSSKAEEEAGMEAVIPPRSNRKNLPDTTDISIS